MAAGSSLSADDLWSSSLKLTGAVWSGLEDEGLGRNVLWGISGEGIYPFSRTHLLACEGGYRSSLTQNKTTTTAFFGGAYYRYRFDETKMNGWLDGLYLQGGARLVSAQTEIDYAKSDAKDDVKGKRQTGIKPLLGAGFRFTDKLSAGFDVTTMSTAHPNGKEKSGTVMEMSMGLHF